jgi:anti-sigma regulatory factor (Ser/Thr protein kinase)
MPAPIELYRGPAERGAWSGVLSSLQAATTHEIDAILKFNLEFVLEEWFDNLCTHGRSLAGLLIQATVILQATQGGFELTLIDDGLPFDPTQARVPDTASGLEERPVGGLGIHLSLQMAANAQYRRDNNINQLTLTWVRPN